MFDIDLSDSQRKNLIDAFYMRLCLEETGKPNLRLSEMYASEIKERQDLLSDDGYKKIDKFSGIIKKIQTTSPGRKIYLGEENLDLMKESIEMKISHICRGTFWSAKVDHADGSTATKRCRPEITLTTTQQKIIESLSSIDEELDRIKASILPSPDVPPEKTNKVRFRPV